MFFNNKPIKNDLGNILWSLERIKMAAHRSEGCTLRHTGGFVHDGQIDDLITIVKSIKNIDDTGGRIAYIQGNPDKYFGIVDKGNEKGENND